MRGREFSADERDLLSRELGFDQSLRAIARLMGRDASVVAREVSRNGGRVDYRAMRAQAEPMRNVLAPSSRAWKLMSVFTAR